MKKQSRKKSRQTLRPAPKQRKSHYDHVVVFPQAKGQTVELLQLIADPDQHCVSIQFQDQTDLTLVFDQRMTFKANYSDWKTGDQRVLKLWPGIRNEG